MNCKRCGQALERVGHLPNRVCRNCQWWEFPKSQDPTQLCEPRTHKVTLQLHPVPYNLREHLLGA